MLQYDKHRSKYAIGALGSLWQWSAQKLGLGGPATPKSERQKVKDDYFSENSKLTDLEQKVAELEGNLGNDFGPDDAFLTLIDR